MFLLSLALIACAAPSPSGDSGSLGLDSGDTQDAARFAVSGTVLDLDDQPVVDMFVTVSTEFCTPGRTDAQGAFVVGNVDAGEKRLITYGDTSSNGLFASVAFAFRADAAVQFDAPVLAPALSETWPIDPKSTVEQVITTNDGLTLSIPAGALTLAPFAPDEIQVARVPVDRAPAFVPEGLTLVDLFVLHPILSTLDPPASVRFPADSLDSIGGLPTGSPVTFYALDYDTGWLVPAATGTVDEDGRPSTSAGQGISELTWVGISVE